MRPTSEKAVTVWIPQGEHRVGFGVDEDTMIESLRYGDADVLRDTRLIVGPDDTRDLQIVLHSR